MRSTSDERRVRVIDYGRVIEVSRRLRAVTNLNWIKRWRKRTESNGPNNSSSPEGRSSKCTWESGQHCDVMCEVNVVDVRYTVVDWLRFAGLGLSG